MFPKKRNPTHPGRVLEELFLKPQNIDAKRFAEMLGGEWSEIKIVAILSGNENLSDQAATDFAEALGTTVEFWQRIAQYYRQWEHVQKNNVKGAVKPWKKAQ